MKAVILAGGYGTRISEESGVRPKPMVEIGGKPILWHIMKIYDTYGINEFIICCGYKGHVIKEYFANYALNHSDITFDLTKNSMEIHKNYNEPWKVTLVDTGYNSMTGGRLKRVKEYIGNETFCMTYGDGLSDVNLHALLSFHRAHGAWATLTAVQQPGRFGAFNLGSEEVKIDSFQEKPHGVQMPWINGGFFVLEPEVLDYIDGDDTIWEREPLENLAANGQLAAYRHEGFWQPMDTLRDKTVLDELWKAGKAPWHEQSLALNILKSQQVTTKSN
ncbi:glucose-1-phosphate cytidylyltransferase [Olivibacter sp. SDN3]|uniref:glucose-1-phosphate cytidylyltransferase n=1 Tax=Olivibacter sp. SDN3 TaxID=2764720 RepID=UPI0016516D67|nr:glucose-1-phosphate cytidylyltransferase [Olivibacter sp. SDN3]QNL51720.1 glucose-1-phosphate cytidylyltransferase [Olivibacter sp. SDN3]